MLKSIAIDDGMPELQQFAVPGVGPQLAEAASGANTEASIKSPVVRKEFPETWIWTESFARLHSLF